MLVRPRALLVLAVAAAVLGGGCRTPGPAKEEPEPRAWIRVNLVGYLPDDPKIAVVGSEVPLDGTFTVGSLQGRVGSDRGSFGPFAHTYRLDFSALRQPGRYRVRVGGRASPAFDVGDDVYATVTPHLRRFLRLQRCGANPVTGHTCHRDDAVDTTDGIRRDLAGGWHDAGDRIKHSITTSYCVAALALAGEEEEAAWGAEYLAKLHPEPQVLYVQVGDDRDHGGGWTPWHEDPVDYGFGPGGARPAWRATGRPEGPGEHRNASTGLASLAGRCAAALALCGDLERARSLYRLARASPGCAQSVPVEAPYHYAERTDQDDLAWAAVELYRAAGDPRHLEEAIRFADRAADLGWMGRARHDHYAFVPYVTLGHWRLWEVAPVAVRERLVHYYRSGLEEVRLRAEANPWRLGTPLVWCSTNDALAFATQAVLYERMTGDDRYRTLAAEARDWVLGRNFWGVSFVTGVPAAGRAATDVHHPYAVLGLDSCRGGLVDGPIAGSLHGALQWTDLGGDPLARFQSEVAVYRDQREDFATNEPILDGTVRLLLLLALWRS